MATENVGILTTKGKALVDRVNSGNTKITYTKIVLSSMNNSSMTDTQLVELTDVVPQEVVIEGPEVILDSNTGETKIRGNGDNTNLLSGVYIKSYGIYAKDDNDNEILYGITVSDHPNYLAPYDGLTPQAITYTYRTKISMTSNINLSNSPDIYVTDQDLKDAISIFVTEENFGDKVRAITDDLDKKVYQSDIINSINNSTETSRVDGAKMHITSSATIDEGVIQSNNIISVSASKITSGVISDPVTVNSIVIASGKISNTVFSDGTLSDTSITGGSLKNSTLSNNTMTGGSLGKSSVSDTAITGGSITNTAIAGGTINNSTIANNTMTGGNISKTVLSTSTLSNNTITGGSISGSTLSDNTITGGTANKVTVTSSTLTGNAISGGTLSSVGITGGTVGKAALSGNTLAGNTITGGTIDSVGITKGTINGTTLSNSTLSGNALSGGTIGNTTITGSTVNNSNINLGAINANSNNTNKVYPLSINNSGDLKSVQFISSTGSQSEMFQGNISANSRVFTASADKSFVGKNINIGSGGISLIDGKTAAVDHSFNAGLTVNNSITLNAQSGIELHGESQGINFKGHTDEATAGMYMNSYGNIIANAGASYWQISANSGEITARFGIDTSGSVPITMYRDVNIGNILINRGHTITSLDNTALHFAKKVGGALDVYVGTVNYSGSLSKSLLSEKKQVVKADTKYWSDLVLNIDLATYKYKDDDNNKPLRLSGIIDDLHQKPSWNLPEEFIGRNEQGKKSGIENVVLQNAMLAAIQEQAKKIDTLSKQISER